MQTAAALSSAIMQETIRATRPRALSGAYGAYGACSRGWQSGVAGWQGSKAALGLLVPTCPVDSAFFFHFSIFPPVNSTKPNGIPFFSSWPLGM